jgi:hypothetical protein
MQLRTLDDLKQHCGMSSTIRIVEQTEKNGPDTVTYVWQIDDSQPVVRIEGTQYYFNKTLIEVRREKGKQK